MRRDSEEGEEEELAPEEGGRRGVGGAQWESTLSYAVKAIVSIRVNLVAAFDTERASSSQASGFVVDAERGIILTNRHVVTPGPITAEAVFYDHEEVPIWPIYRDPVHDFGFFRFDVKKVNFMEVVAIPLAPELARVGVEVRVVGNDAGEKLSILAGTLARLDRKAPSYGLGKYNDFNTFYFQAASSTSGGSSGSPVLDLHGNAIAMNAGGKKKAASSFYIPLDRVKRALTLIQHGTSITRGTLQTIFHYQPYDEVRRLGLQKETEETVRREHPEETGMLVVEQVIPNGPADGLLEPGDILLQLQGAFVQKFTLLEAILDEAVGKRISITFERGSQQRHVEILVQDLHSITPCSYCCWSGATLNEFSFQMARSYSMPVGGVYVACPGYMLSMANISRNSIITAVDKIPTPNLEEFIKAIQTFPDGARVPFRYFFLSDIHRERVSVVQIDHHWHSLKKATRNDTTGLWDFEHFPSTQKRYRPKPASTTFPMIEKDTGPSSLVIPSLVTVEFFVPFSIDGVHGNKFIGTGLIVDAEKGLIVTDANTIPISIGDISITFAGSIIVPGELVYLHAIHNYVVISYDPSLIGATPVKSAILSEVPLVQSDSVYLVGLHKPHVPVCRKTVVTKVREVMLRESNPPRYRPTNLEGIEVDHPVSCLGGVLADEQGRVQGLWLSFSFQENEGEDSTLFLGLPIDYIRYVVDPLRKGISPIIRSLEVELSTIPFSQARDLGLSEEWMERLSKESNKRTTVMVRRLVAGSPAGGRLREGDLILAANGRMVTGLRDLDCQFGQEAVRLVVVREGREEEQEVPTMVLSGQGTQRIIGWGGVLLQEAHRAAAQQRKTLPQGVYSSWWSNGSPAHMYGLRATIWITELNGTPVPDLSSFLAVLRRWKEEGEQRQEESGYVRVKTVDFANKVRVLTLRPNDLYWPLWELRRESASPSGWVLSTL